MSTATLTPLRVLMPFPAHALSAQHMILEPLGFAADEGLTVMVDFCLSPIDSTAAVAEARYDVTEVNTLFTFQRREEGLPVKAYFSVCRGPYRSIAVPFDSPIRRVEQLRNATIGIDHPDLELLVGAVLRSHELAPASVNWVTWLADFVPTQDDIDSLRDGRIDAVSVLACEFEMLAEHGVKLRRLPTPTLNRLTPGACLYANSDVLASSERRLRVDAYGRALARGIAYCQEHPEASVRLAWEHYPEARPKGDEERSLRRDVAALRGRNMVCDLRHGDIHRWGAVSEREVRAWEAFFFANGIVSEMRDPGEYFDSPIPT